MDEHNMEHMTHHDHNQSHQHSGHMMNFKKRFWWSVIFSIPIIALSPMMGMALPFQVNFPGSNWIVLIFATIIYFYGGKPFLMGAKSELKQKNPAMMTLISLGISVAYFYSLYAFVLNLINPSNQAMDFFWELDTLILIMLLGHWIEMSAVSNAGNAMQKMAELLPNQATVVMDNGQTMTMSLQEVREGQKVLVKSGENIPTDGVIIKGQTSVNESMVTGEAQAVQKKVGDSVIGGSSNGDGTITIKVTGTGESGYLSQVMNLVSQAQQEKSRVESLSDKVAKWLFYVAVSVGVIAFIVWILITKSFGTALERMVTVLIIACPHALGLAIPLVTARSTSLGAQNGLLVKNRQALETAQHIDCVMMDKTGTLTEGHFKVNHYQSLTQDYTDQEILGYFASIETHSNHPLAASVVAYAKEQNIQLQSIDDVTTVSGVGPQGTIQQKTVQIVNPRYLKEHQIDYDTKQFDDLSSQGNTVSYLLVNQKNVGLIAQGDQIKPESKQLVQQLKELGIEPIMLTGDNQQTAQAVAKELGITTFHAELLPQDKESMIRDYRDKGQQVMMVGDGINDAPALARANVGMAIGAGTDVAIDSADVILVKSNPLDIVKFFTLAKRTSRKMKQNLWWGAGYNIIAIPLAAGILAPVGIILSPAVGAVFMSLSTVIVAINALLLKID
ncbi:copper-translocating P-type ATPase [Vagococcus penaei]|uniref:P-type Cu(+) transporter n=1 Tax=Vagococcus penaei TaxID=633807 RepID=A0A1Q2D5P0_9ENTE|nr:heavy metal translocating P-type ATPase [Vagococcus penaei]AQP53694.1 copper-translocating P-type ATPase [Vagococcus penaei]RST97161.1 copper-translocating P-type ATPase [Vagococcus penaei]